MSWGRRGSGINVNGRRFVRWYELEDKAYSSGRKNLLLCPSFLVQEDTGYKRKSLLGRRQKVTSVRVYSQKRYRDKGSSKKEYVKGMRMKRLWCEEKKSKHSRHWLWLQFVMCSFFFHVFQTLLKTKRTSSQRQKLYFSRYFSLCSPRVSLSLEWLGCLFSSNLEKDLPAREIKDATANESNNSHNRFWKGTESRNEEMKKRDACLKFTEVWKESNHDVSLVVSSVLLTSFSHSRHI